MLLFLDKLVWRLARDTGALDTLDKCLLTEAVYNDQRNEDHKTAGIADRSLIKVLSRIRGVERTGYSDNVGHKLGTRCRIEYVGVEVVCPLPGEGEKSEAKRS